ncbi:PD40 domain-containing protein [Streptomyces sp. WAC 06725]|uniref:TolB family protein n=1 Tax=Streptomyces sp. WAC 06725 TaxID=2203209 RepID=UPI000F7480E4|nr:PD40 domain-containing protein [Streptomyces sp. WAC 06725]
MRRWTTVLAVLAAACVTTLPAASALGADTGTAGGSARRVSVSATGAQADGDSSGAVLSANGRVVVFTSQARNLVPGTPEGTGIQLYAKDLRTGRVDLVSANPDGSPGYEPGYVHAVSADGRYVAFDSPSSTLDPRDSGDGMDVFLRDRRTGTTELITRHDGDPGAGRSFLPSISADGRYLAFTSLRADLVPGDTNDRADVFVRDRQRGTTRRVSVASDGTQADAASDNAVISADGRQVAFTTEAKNLFPWPQGTPGIARPQPPYVSFGVHDLRTGETRAGAYNQNGIPARVQYGLHFSPDGRYLLFDTSDALLPGDESGWWGFYSRDLRTGAYARLAARPDGGRPTGSVTGAGLSADNRTAFFTTNAPDLVPDDTNGTWDVFARDLRSGEVTRLGSTPDGGPPAEGSYGVSPDRRGRLVAFTSASADLVPGDTNGATDIFVRRLR